MSRSTESACYCEQLAVLDAKSSQECVRLYICVCNAIRESELRLAACCAKGDVEAVYASLGATPNCCQCLDEATMIIEDEREMALLPVYAE